MKYGYYTDNSFGNRRIITIGRRGRNRQIGDIEVASEMGERILDIRSPHKWSTEKNYAWVQEAIRNGDVFYLASPITKKNLLTEPPYGINIFGRELDKLLHAGYRKKGNYLVPAELAK